MAFSAGHPVITVWLVNPVSQCVAGQTSQSMGGWSVQSVSVWLVSPDSQCVAGQSSQCVAGQPVWLVEWQVPADAGVDAASHSLATPTHDFHSRSRSLDVTAVCERAKGKNLDHHHNQ